MARLQWGLEGREYKEKPKLGIITEFPFSLPIVFKVLQNSLANLMNQVYCLWNVHGRIVHLSISTRALSRGKDQGVQENSFLRHSLVPQIPSRCQSSPAQKADERMQTTERWGLPCKPSSSLWSHGTVHIPNVPHRLAIGLEGNGHHFLPITSRLSRSLKTEIETGERARWVRALAMKIWGGEFRFYCTHKESLGAALCTFIPAARSR